MNNRYDDHMSRFSSMLCEDVCAPELRNPNNSALRATGWFKRIFKGGNR